MKAEKRPTEMQLLALNIIIEKGFGPITKEAPSPANCRPISPSRLPPSTFPYFSIESFFMLQATMEAPPKMAAVRPRQVGTIDGLIALAIAIIGAPPNPKPTIPNPNMALRRGVLTGLKNSIFSLALSLSVSTRYLGCMELVERKPTMAAKDPPRERGHIMPYKAGIDKTAYEEASAPPKASPVVVYTVDRNLFTPTFLEMAQLVVRPEVATVSQDLSLAKYLRLRVDVRSPNEAFLAIVLNAPIIQLWQLLQCFWKRSLDS